MTKPQKLLLTPAIYAGIGLVLSDASSLAAETNAKASNTAAVTGRPITIDNHTPFDWVAVAYRPALGSNEAWLPIVFKDTTTISRNDRLEVTMPGTTCLYDLRVKVETDAEPIFGHYSLDVCSDPNPQLK